MQFPKILAFASMVLAVSAVPNYKPSTTTSTTVKPTTTAKPTTTSTKATSSPTPTGTNNGGQFLTQCENVGLSVLDCTDLLNIAALNGNHVNVGGTTTPPPGAVNNGAQFLTECRNLGISVADCAEVLNLAILNGNSIDIDLTSLTNLLTSLGLSGLLANLLKGLGGLLGTSLIAIPAGTI